MEHSELDGLRARIAGLHPVRAVGRVRSVDGAVIWVGGLTHGACIGDRLRLLRQRRGPLDGEVLRLTEDAVAMLPDDGFDGVSRGDRGMVLGPPTLAPWDGWIGRVIDPYGQPLDGEPLTQGSQSRAFSAPPPPAARRHGLGRRLETGVAAFNTLLPIVQGQRIGLFAGSGIGKSRLLARLARGVQADVVVLALIGERGREVRDFVANVLGPEGMKRSVVVAATSDRSPVERRRCPLAAMTIAEHFRDRGAHVLFLADSITRFAEAHREVAIASGELPALRGFPASMAHQIMQLAERAGPGVGHSGDITGIFSVLVAASDMDEPVADVLRGVLDGHVVLDRQIAERGRFPAIDILRSVSRSLPEAASTDENALISQTRQLLGAYSGAETMIRAGLYREGSDPLIDQAIRAWPEIEGFIGEDAHTDIATCFSRLRLILRRVSASPGRAAGPRSNGQSSQVATRARS